MPNEKNILAVVDRLSWVGCQTILLGDDLNNLLQPLQSTELHQSALEVTRKEPLSPAGFIRGIRSQVERFDQVSHFAGWRIGRSKGSDRNRRRESSLVSHIARGQNPSREIHCFGGPLCQSRWILAILGTIQQLCGNPTRGYPPSGPAYHSKTDPEAAYLWRWVGMHAPDLVVDIRGDTQQRWFVPQTLSRPYQQLSKR